MKALLVMISALTAFLSLFFTSAESQWVRTTPPFSTDWLQVRSFAVIGTNLFANSNIGIFRSTDKGATWSAVNVGLTDTVMPGTTNTFTYCMAASGTNLFTGTVGGIFMSTNNGASWRDIDGQEFTGVPSRNRHVHAIAVRGSDLFIGTTGGIYLSSDTGKTWSPIFMQHTPTNYIVSLDVHDSTLYAQLFEDPDLFLSTDNGKSWTPYNKISVTDVDQNAWSAKYPYILASVGHNYLQWPQVSTDFGQTWTPYPQVLDWELFATLYDWPYSFAVSDSLIFLGCDRHVMVSRFPRQGSDTWTDFTGYASGPGQSVFALLINGSDLIAGTGDGIWKRPLSDLKYLPLVPPVLLNPGSPITKNVVTLRWYPEQPPILQDSSGVYNYYRYDVRVSRDISFQTQELFTAGRNGPDTSLVLGANGELAPNTTYYWSVRAINFLKGKGPWSLASFTTSAFLTEALIDSGGVPKYYSLSQNYPNPFNPSTTIEFSLPRSGLVTLKIFNLLGEEVATLMNGVRPAGTYRIGWNASGSPSGIYFYRMQAGDLTETKKLILLR